MPDQLTSTSTLLGVLLAAGLLLGSVVVAFVLGRAIRLTRDTTRWGADHNIVDLDAQRRLRALQRAIERHPVNQARR